ncbi:hypothetical protein Hanom_Chr07g00628761 [Helianthus anomalus]
MISAFKAFGLTGSVCLKSPPNRTDFPPNGLSWFPRTSLRLLSKDSKHRRSLIGASSQIIRDVSKSRCASCVCFLMLHRESSVKSSGILNREWAVLPDGNNSDAIPDAATAKTIFPVDLRAAIIAVHKYVLPVPPWPYTNKSTCTLSLTDLRTLSYIVRCRSFKPRKIIIFWAASASRS